MFKLKTMAGKIKFDGIYLEVYLQDKDGAIYLLESGTPEILKANYSMYSAIDEFDAIDTARLTSKQYKKFTKTMLKILAHNSAKKCVNEAAQILKGFYSIGLNSENRAKLYEELYDLIVAHAEYIVTPSTYQIYPEPTNGFYSNNEFEELLNKLIDYFKLGQAEIKEGTK